MNNDKYYQACILGIRSIDEVYYVRSIDEFYYGRKAPNQIRVLRRVLDLILNHDKDLNSWSDDPTIDRAKKIEGVYYE